LIFDELHKFPKLIFYSCKNNIMLLRVDRGALKVLGTTDGSLKDL